MQKNEDPISDFPQEYILDLYLKFSPEMVNERIAYIDLFVQNNQNRFVQGFLEKNINGQKGLVYYEGKQFEQAAVHYAASAEKLSPADPLYFHEFCMAARCYRLAGHYSESEKWIMQAYAQKHLMPHVFALLDLLADYTALLNDTGRMLPAEYQEDLETIIAETGMELAIKGHDLNATVMEMKKLNHETNRQFGKIVISVSKETAAESALLLETFIRQCRIRYYREEAGALLQNIKGL